MPLRTTCHCPQRVHVSLHRGVIVVDVSAVNSLLQSSVEVGRISSNPENPLTQGDTQMRSLLHALPAALLSVLGGTSGAASQIQPAAVESFAHSALLSVRVIDGEPNHAGDHEAMAVVVSTITEMVRLGCRIDGSPMPSQTGLRLCLDQIKDFCV